MKPKLVYFKLGEAYLYQPEDKSISRYPYRFQMTDGNYTIIKNDEVFVCVDSFPPYSKSPVRAVLLTKNQDGKPVEVIAWDNRINFFDYINIENV